MNSHCLIKVNWWYYSLGSSSCKLRRLKFDKCPRQRARFEKPWIRQWLSDWQRALLDLQVHQKAHLQKYNFPSHCQQMAPWAVRCFVENWPRTPLNHCYIVNFLHARISSPGSVSGNVIFPPPTILCIVCMRRGRVSFSYYLPLHPFLLCLFENMIP